MIFFLFSGQKKFVNLHRSVESKIFLKNFSGSSFANEKEQSKKIACKNFWRQVGVGFGNGDGFFDRPTGRKRGFFSDGV